MRTAWVVVVLAACHQPLPNEGPDAGVHIHDSMVVHPDAPTPPHPDAPLPMPDAYVPDAFVPDAPPPPPVCGDGVRAPGEVCFGTPVMIDAGELVYSARLRDVDGDGNLDLIYLTRTNVVVRRGDGSGGFAAPAVGPATASWWVDVGDIDGDGIADVVATGRQLLTVWFGTGGGAFGSPHTVSLFDGPIALAVTEIDGYPGKEIVVQTAAYLYAFTWFVNDFDNLSQNGSYATALAVGDINGDSHSDVVYTGDRYLYPFLGGVDGLSPNGYVGGDTVLAGAALANVDTDPTIDAVAAAPAVQKILVYSKVENKPDNTTHSNATELWPVTTGTPRFVATADLDGDGISEVMAGMPDTMRLQLFHPGGTSDAPIQLAEPMASQFFDGDANGDGFADLVVTLTDKIVVVPTAAP